MITYLQLLRERRLLVSDGKDLRVTQAGGFSDETNWVYRDVAEFSQQDIDIIDKVLRSHMRPHNKAYWVLYRCLGRYLAKVYTWEYGDLIANSANELAHMIDDLHTRDRWRSKKYSMAV